MLKGIGWVGARTPEYRAMVDFCRDVLQLALVSDSGDFAEFALPNADRFEVFGAENPDNPYIRERAVEFLVQDIADARAVLEARGVVFLGPIQSDPAGVKWTHFRAPDGRIYGLTSRDDSGYPRSRETGGP